MVEVSSVEVSIASVVVGVGAARIHEQAEARASCFNCSRPSSPDLRSRPRFASGVGTFASVVTVVVVDVVEISIIVDVSVVRVVDVSMLYECDMVRFEGLEHCLK